MFNEERRGEINVGKERRKLRKRVRDEDRRNLFLLNSFDSHIG
jgi:hypothetical protein